jgi:molybdopterin molybdotransferase
MRSGLTPAEAAATILETAHPLPSETVSLIDALDRVAAESVRSPLDLPPWDNSAMDGYAVRADDVDGQCPVELAVIGEIAAGQHPDLTIRHRECVRIYTGGPVPPGTDGVIRQEDTSPLPHARVRINVDRDARRNVRPQGEDIRRDAVVLENGTSIGPAHVGLLASVGRSAISVHRRPRVAIMTSGDEIADLDEQEAILEGRKLGSSNTYTLLSLVRRAGGEPLHLGIARDDPDDIRTRLGGADRADLVVTSGGVSVGPRDYLRPVMRDLGADMVFWRIRMRPGAPVAYGRLPDRPWLGLPGNPVSTMVTFELFVRPVIRALLGHRACFRRTVRVRTAEPIRTHAPLQHFLRVVVTDGHGGPVAHSTGPQGSGLLTSMAQANALLIVPEDRMEVPKGEWLDAILLDDPVHVHDVPF